eukprot:3116779-Ditylum_brightwellii.AAC.1
MPFYIGTETDGGSNRNHNHFQNFCVDLAFFALSGVDAMFAFRGCPRRSFLNSSKRAMPILNLA